MSKTLLQNAFSAIFPTVNWLYISTAYWFFLIS